MIIPIPDYLKESQLEEVAKKSEEYGHIISFGKSPAFLKAMSKAGDDFPDKPMGSENPYCVNCNKEIIYCNDKGNIPITSSCHC